MSILIKGMDMPKEMKEAESVDMIIYYNGNRFVKEINPSRFVDIPTPHGRLIDKDELLSHLSKDPLFDLVERYGVSGVIESRPTILEAEKE